MLAVSPLMKQAAPFSQTIGIRADLLVDNEVVKSGLNVVGGDVSSDRSRKVRLQGSVELALWPWEELDFGVNIHRIRLYRGVESLGRRELLPIGTFRVDEIKRSVGGGVQADLSGLEAYIDDARFLVPRTPPRGSSTTQAISELIRQVLPNATIRVEATRNKLVQATAPWDRERWDAIDYLAKSIDCEVFVDARGDFVIRDTPSLDGTPVIYIKEGEEGLLVDVEESYSRDQVYNIASVSGQSSDPNIPPVHGEARITDPADELYVYGPYGQVPIFYVSNAFTNDAQCVAYAAKLLAQARATNATLTFTTPPTLWWLEVGDIVGVQRLNGTLEKHMLDTGKVDLAADSNMQFGTVSSKTVVREDLGEES